MRKLALLLGLTLLLALTIPAAAQSSSQPTDATTAILGAFNNYNIVAVDDAMNIQQAADFYTALVTNPTFAANVGNVVIDFGNSADQSTVDNYLAGQTVSDSDLQKVWINSADFGGFGAGGAQGAAPAVPQSYSQFLSAILKANQSLPDNQKIHVWLGGQVVTRQGNGGAQATPDASGNNGGAQATPPVTGQRGNGGGRGGFGGAFAGANNGQFLANLIETQILSQNKKALVIARVALFNPTGTTFGFGGRGGQFPRGNRGQGNGGGAGAQATPQAQPQGTQQAFTPPQSVRQIIEKDYPGKTIVAVVHRGMQEPDCNSSLESLMSSWKAPVVAVIQGTQLQTMLSSTSCHELGSFGQTSIDEGWADGYLYLGPVASLTMSPTSAGGQPQSYLDYIQQLQQQLQQLQQQFQQTPEATQSA